MNTFKQIFQGLHNFILLWATQGLSTLGSSMTSYALIIWAYEQEGSALTTSLLSVSSYAPYVLLSIFAGALSDRWDKKRTMLVCDTLAALSTIAVLMLLLSGNLRIWHLYLINAFNGLMNTVQQPASDVAVSLLAPREQYQRTAGMRAFSNSLVTILTPVIATTVLSFFGLGAVILFDLMTFAAAFLTLAFFIHIPNSASEGQKQNLSVRESAREGLAYLRANRGIFNLILFLAAINLTASMYEAALPALLLSRTEGGKSVLGLVTACTGIANIAGSIAVSFLPAPKRRIPVIWGALLFSMGTENFLLAFGRGPIVWCIGAILGWIMLPLMNTNMDALFRLRIPVEMQGRVYSMRNTFQFFTIPLGYLSGGFLIDYVLEPLMRTQPDHSLLTVLFGTGKGSGAAVLYFLIGTAGVLTCAVFRKNKHIWNLEKDS